MACWGRNVARAQGSWWRAAVTGRSAKTLLLVRSLRMGAEPPKGAYGLREEPFCSSPQTGTKPQSRQPSRLTRQPLSHRGCFEQ